MGMGHRKPERTGTSAERWRCCAPARTPPRRCVNAAGIGVFCAEIDPEQEGLASACQSGRRAGSARQEGAHVQALLTLVGVDGRNHRFGDRHRYRDHFGHLVSLFMNLATGPPQQAPPSCSRLGPCGQRQHRARSEKHSRRCFSECVGGYDKRLGAYSAARECRALTFLIGPRMGPCGVPPCAGPAAGHAVSAGARSG